VGRVIKCAECGYEMEGDDDDQLLENAANHVEIFHPELADRLSRKDFGGWIREE
jgi:predicted small metal-binding protein